MEYYDNTPAKLNIKLRDIPLDRTTNSQYKVIYGGLNETLPKMENEFSNLKIRVKEYNKSRNSSPENSDLINNNILYTQQNNIKINQVKTLNDNNNITNNNNNIFRRLSAAYKQKSSSSTIKLNYSNPSDFLLDV